MLHKLLAHILLAVVIAALFLPADLNAQQNPVDLQVRSALYGSSQRSLPFWLHSNRDGKVDSSGINWINEVRMSRNLFDNGNLSVEAGGNLVGRLSKESSAHFNELYLHADLGGYRLSLGRFIDPIGLNNHELSVGSMMVSRNATPVPKISISTPEFLDVPFTGGHLQYKGMFNHGRLEDGRFVSNALLHQKYFYLRVNAGRFSGTGGLIHNVVWGGTHPRFGSLPQSFGDFLRVVTGQAAESDGAPGNDLANVIGNSVAAYEFGLQYNHQQYTASITRLFYLEDKVSTRFRSPWDGVWAFNFSTEQKDRFITDVIYEHINTIQQDAKPSEGRGRAMYYHNDVYRSGWTYNEQVLGLPLILFNPEDLYLEEGSNIKNNMIIAHHIGAGGTIAESLGYKLLATYSRNYGHNPDRLPPEELNREQRRTDQYSLYLGLEYRLPGVEHLALTFSLAGDLGQLYETNTGLGLGISWKPFLSNKETK